MQSPLRNVRKAHGFTLQHVAAGVQVNPATLSRIERLEQIPSIELAERLANFFKGEVSEMQILYPEETTRSPLQKVSTLVSADDVTAQLLLRTPRSGIFAPPRLSGSYQQTPLCWGVASTCSRWAEKAGSASCFQASLM